MRPRPLSLPLCCLLLAAASLAPPGRAAERQQVMVEDAASPWSNRRGEGYANDLVRAAFAAAGVDVELVVVPYARCKALVMQGGAASCLSMAAAPELDALVRFADTPLYSATPHFYYSRDQRPAAQSVATLAAGMRVGTVFGYEYPPFIAALAARGIVFEAARSDAENLRKLSAHRIDFALLLTDDMRSERLMRQQRGGRVGVAFKGARQDSFIGFSTRHPDGEAQRRAFNAGFKAIGENGLRQTIHAEWKRRCASACDE